MIDLKTAIAVTALSCQLSAAALITQNADQIRFGYAAQEKQTFKDTSIYRQPRDGISITSEHSPPSFHLYDNFGKDSPMPGLSTFSHINWTDCFARASDGIFDIGIVGMPFDLGVSYRPGQRFGPAAARAASQRMAPFISWR